MRCRQTLRASRGCTSTSAPSARQSSSLRRPW
jgi:hypothetical protein